MLIAHRRDGLHVYDVKSAKVIKTLQQSENANTSALAPEFGLGIAGTTDGHVVVFNLSTLKTLSRHKNDTDGFDGATFDEVSMRFAMVGEADEEKKTTPVLFFDGKTGKPAGSVVVDSVKVDAPRPDGKGSMTVTRQKSADDYRLSETIGTHPMARTGVLDEKANKIYLVNAQYVNQYA